MELAEAITRWFRNPTTEAYLTIIGTCEEPVPLHEIWQQLARKLGKPVLKRNVALELQALEKRGLLTRHQRTPRAPKFYSLSVIGRVVLAAESPSSFGIGEQWCIM